MSEQSYAERWADAINETYGDAEAWHFLNHDDYLPGEDADAAGKRILTKAAQCLRNEIPATFTMGELDLVRHLMPAHEVHQSGAVPFVGYVYGDE